MLLLLTQQFDYVQSIAHQLLLQAKQAISKVAGLFDRMWPPTQPRLVGLAVGP
jgi:hypothetical protein